jgi:hypothetical protein
MMREERPTPNAERPILNGEFSSAFDIRRWAFDVFFLPNQFHEHRSASASEGAGLKISL